MDSFFGVLSDPIKEVQNFHIVVNDTIQVEWIYKKDCQPEDNKQYLFGDLYHLLGQTETLYRPRTSRQKGSVL